MSKNIRVGRLAMREEGTKWVAYYAQDDTMEDAVELGSLAMVFAADIERKNQFMGLMKECVADLIEEHVGVRPAWGGTEPAPEHEKEKKKAH